MVTPHAFNESGFYFERFSKRNCINAPRAQGVKIAPKMNFFAVFFEKLGKKNVPRNKSAVHSKVHKILNKIRVNSNRISLRQEEDNLSVRVKAERRNKNAAGLTPRDYPVRWVLFSRLNAQPVSSLSGNHRA